MGHLTPEQLERKRELTIKLLTRLAKKHPAVKQTLDKLQDKDLMMQFDIIHRDFPMMSGLTLELLEDREKVEQFIHVFELMHP